MDIRRENPISPESSECTPAPGRVSYRRDSQIPQILIPSGLAEWNVGTWPANALRKTFISCHYESFGSVDATAKEAGTSVAMIHAHYRKIIKKKDADRFWQIRPADASGNVTMIA